MIDTVLNLLFRCPHHRLTRPVAPVTKVGQPSSQSYVVCLDCGKQFEYDVKQMRIGKPIDRSPDTLKPPKPKLKLAVQGLFAAAVVVGAMFKFKKK